MADVAVLSVLLKLDDKLSAGLKSAYANLGVTTDQLKKAGAVLSAFGAIGIGVAAIMVKGAKEQEIGIAQLDQSLKNIGTSYLAQKESIEAVIEAQQRKTNFGDEAQRESLNRLVTFTGNYEESLMALPAVLDFATKFHLDLESASSVVGKALVGNTETLRSRYLPSLVEGATATQVLAEMTKQFGGAAAAAADPLVQMRNRIGEAGEAIGKVMLPAVDAVARVLERFAAWVSNLDPKLLTFAVVVGGVAVAFAAIAGPALLFLGFLPSIAAGFTLAGTTATAAATGVSGLAASFGALVVSAAPVVAGILAVVAVAAAGAAVLRGLLNAFDNLTMGTEKETNAWKILKGDMANLVDGARDLMKGFGDLLVPSTDVEKMLADMRTAAEEAGEGFKTLGEGTGGVSSLLLALVADAETTETAFADLEAQQRKLGSAIGSFTLEEAVDLAGKMRAAGFEAYSLDDAMLALSERGLATLTKEAQAALDGILGLNHALEETESLLWVTTPAFGELETRLEEMGRPMQDLLSDALKLSDMMFNGSHNAKQLSAALEILARANLDDLDAQVQQFAEGLRQGKTAAEETTEALKGMAWQQMFGIPTGTMLEQVGRNWALHGIELQEAAQLSSVLGLSSVFGEAGGTGAQRMLRGALGIGEAKEGAIALPLEEIARAAADVRKTVLLSPGQNIPLDMLAALLRERWKVPLMDTGGLVKGPGVFAVGPGVKEIVREPGGPIVVEVYLDGHMIGGGIGKRARDDEQVRGF